MTISRQAIKPRDIPFLNRANTLYACDFRAISENMDYKIPTMWKYENLLPWILKDRTVLVGNTEGITYRTENNLIAIEPDTDPRTSLFARAEKKDLPKKEALWVAIPHPEADALAKAKNLNLNYAYEDFLARNDKIKQKELLGDLSPTWHRLKSKQEIEEKSTGFLKRTQGSGGFTVFDLSNTKKEKLKELFKDPTEWYWEEKAEGAPHSIQCVVMGEKIIVFGFSEQIIEEEKYYAGSKIKSVSEIPESIYAQLTTAIERLAPMLEGYEGFFGVDFLLDGETIQVLEANIRMTAATIPTLLVNTTGASLAVFKEDDQIPDSENVITLTIDHSEKLADTLTFFEEAGSVGQSIQFQLEHAEQIPKAVDDHYVSEIRALVDKHISKTIDAGYVNFWPFGWTVSFILEESHCVISSWFLEKKILFDIFSCRQQLPVKPIINAFASFFSSPKITNVETAIR